MKLKLGLSTLLVFSLVSCSLPNSISTTGNKKTDTAQGFNSGLVANTDKVIIGMGSQNEIINNSSSSSNYSAVAQSSTAPNSASGSYSNYSPVAQSSTAPSAVTGTTSDVKELATLNGKVYDLNGMPIDGAMVTAKSIDPLIPWTGQDQITANGAYVFRNAPVGGRIEITATKDGVTKTRTEVLKSNLTGNPDANKYDFGGPTDTANIYGIPKVNSSGRNSLYISFDESYFTLDTIIIVEYQDIVGSTTLATVQKKYSDGPFTISNIVDNSTVKITVNKPDGTNKIYSLGINFGDRKIKLSENNFSILALKSEDAEENSIDSSINHFIKTENEHLSTFSADVDTASYTIMRNMVNNQNRLPNKNEVRTEEYLNYFNYKYQSPKNDLFNIVTDISTSPVGPTSRKILKIGLQAKDVAKHERKPAILTFVIDISGSMGAEERLPVVKKSLSLLVNSLKPNDKVGIVVFGSDARVLMEHRSVENKQEILNAITNLNVEGSTNTEAGLVEGFKLAAKYYRTNSNNRVILCSDGMANVGITDPETLVKKLKSYSEGEIGLSTVGFGVEYNDSLMETLADKSNGYYAYVDKMQEAYRVFFENLNGSLENFAKDVKIQVDFNPDIVKRYRLLGYEDRKLNNSDFRNDKVDAGEVGINTSVTALYEVEMKDSYKNEDKIAEVFVRFKEAKTYNNIKEQSKAVYVSNILENFNKANADFKLASAVAMYAEILRDSYWSKYASYDTILALAKDAQNGYQNYQDLNEFIEIVRKAKAISGKNNYTNDTGVNGR